MECRRFSQTMASKWQTAFVVSHKMPWCALLTAVKNYNKVLKNCKTFSSRPRPRPRPNVQDQDFMIRDQDQDQDFHFCPRGASRPRPWSRGLHHWLAISHTGLPNSLGVCWCKVFPAIHPCCTGKKMSKSTEGTPLRSDTSQQSLLL